MIYDTIRIREDLILHSAVNTTVSLMVLSLPYGGHAYM